MLCEKDSLIGGRFLQDCEIEEQERVKKLYKSSIEILKKSRDISVKLNTCVTGIFDHGFVLAFLNFSIVFPSFSMVFLLAPGREHGVGLACDLQTSTASEVAEPPPTERRLQKKSCFTIYYRDSYRNLFRDSK